jgi:hypothetical protein
MQNNNKLVSILTVISFLGLALPLPAAADDDLTAENVLSMAQAVGGWLANQAIVDARGTSWPDDVLNPEQVGYDLASGVAGKVVFFSGLYRATGNDDYLDMALGGADYLLSVINDPAAFEGNPRRASLYAGIAGIGVALQEAIRLSVEPKYNKGLDRVMGLLEEWRVVEAEGLRWSDDFNDLIYGDAGTALFLASAAVQRNDAKLLETASRSAHFLLSQAQATEAGSFWYFRRSKDFNLPNFSHGTAGVSYVLATVGGYAKDEVLLAGAAAGFEYLRSIAEIEDGILRIPYGWGLEHWDGLYEFGWAHGLAGDALLFERLQQVGIRPLLAKTFEDLAKNTILNIGLPGPPVEPFAEPSTPLDWRFGRAGTLLVLSRWDDAPEELAVVRNTIWQHIAAAATRDGHGVHWEVDAPAFMGGGRAAYTGLFHGAAGIGLAALHLHAGMTGHDPYVRLPDAAHAAGSIQDSYTP